MRYAAVVVLTVALAMLGYAAGRSDGTCELTLKLVDSSTGRELPGLLRIRDSDGAIIKPAELLPRGLGLRDQLASYGGSIHDWIVLPKSTTVKLPRKPLIIDAVAGLETEMTTARLDLTNLPTASETLSLLRFTDSASRGQRSANTHLHLMKLRREDADRYLVEVPQADGLDMLFVSYLERAGADQVYITNSYTSDVLTRREKQSG
ncbi:MAG: hypothetical protein AB7O26_16145, partial [Planctomycetaceae bacterium]